MRQKITIAIIALALIVAFLFLGRDDADEAPVPAPEPPSPEEPMPTPATEPVRSDAVPPVATLATNETLEVDRAALPAGEPLVLHLQLGELAAGAEALAARLVVEAREPVNLTAAIRSAEPGVARLELDPRWLSPGRNIIEVKTNERSHFPLRRYVVEVH